MFSHLGGEESKMTDVERDRIDADAELYIKTCVSAIQQLRTHGSGSLLILCHTLIRLLGPVRAPRL